MTQDELEAYGRALYRRRDQIVPFLHDPGVASSHFEPLPNSCHDNVDRLELIRPELSAVRGWWVCDYGSVVAFRHHSMIRSENDLIDITPRPQLWNYPLLLDSDPTFLDATDALGATALEVPATDRSQREIRQIQEALDLEFRSALRRNLSGR